MKRIRLVKEALILESSLNRIALRTEWQSVRSVGSRMATPSRALRSFSPWLVILAPVAGFLVARRLRRPGAWLARVASLLRLAVPALSLWRTLAGRSRSTGSGKPAQS